MVKVWITGRSEAEKTEQSSTNPTAPRTIPLPENISISRTRPGDLSQNDCYNTAELSIRTAIPQKREFSQAFPASKQPTDLDAICTPSHSSRRTSSDTEREDTQEKDTTSTMKGKTRCDCPDAGDEDIDECVICCWSYDDERNNEVTPMLSPLPSLVSDSTLAAEATDSASRDEAITEPGHLPRYRCHCPGKKGEENPYFCDNCCFESYEAEQGRIALTRTRTPSLNSLLGDPEPEEEEYKPVPNKKGYKVHWDPDVKDTGYHKKWTKRPESRTTREKDEGDVIAGYVAFQLALEQIPDLGYLDEETVEQAVWLLGQAHTDIVREVADDARERRGMADPRLLARGEADTEADTEDDTKDDDEAEWETESESESEDDNETNELDDISISESEMRVAMDEILHQTTVKAFLQCIEEHVEAVVLCTHCRFLHHSSFYTTDPLAHAPCPATEKLSLSSHFSTASVEPRDNLFVKPLNFIDLQTAMKVWRSDDWNWIDFKYKMGLVHNHSDFTLEKGLQGTINYTWWGSSAVTTEFFVANSRGKDRLMYRTQHFWYMKDQCIGTFVKKHIENEMRDFNMGRWKHGVRGLCDHQSHQKFWEFNDPGIYAGVKRCDQCALEWEVCHGDVMSEESLHVMATKLDFSGKIKREMKSTRKTVIETGPRPDRSKRPTKPKKIGELIVLTCWRDFGACKSVCDPRWSAHFSEYQNREFLHADRLRDEDGWMTDENEEPAQDWELGSIKKAFETVDFHAGQEGIGDIESRLDEKYRRRLKMLLGENWKEYHDTVTVQFKDMTRISPGPSISANAKTSGAGTPGREGN
ncbi:hypothetical protein BDZ45DRAFT_741064 [Acephala macrosclerotiorum]|nr:hypothetical protein BDZ45DRAFT_741064 [Acephala macrosclerotiorum]